MKNWNFKIASLAAFVIGLIVACGKINTGSAVATYLMLFESCKRTDVSARCDTASENHKIYLAQSENGTNWTLVPGFQSYQGTKPTGVRRGNYLYLFDKSRFVRRYDIVTDNLEEPVAMVFKQTTNLAGPDEYFASPSAILDSTNRITIFYLVGNNTGTDPALCSTATCTKSIRSATEVQDSNGTQFVMDSGTRASFDISNGQSLSEPNILTSTIGYLMLVNQDDQTLARYSPTLKDSYVDISGLPNSILANSVGTEPTGYYNQELGEYWTYLRRIQTDGSYEISRAKHGTLGISLTTANFTTVMTAQSLGLEAGYSVENPVFIYNTNAN